MPRKTSTKGLGQDLLSTLRTTSEGAGGTSGTDPDNDGSAAAASAAAGAGPAVTEPEPEPEPESEPDVEPGGAAGGAGDSQEGDEGGFVSGLRSLGFEDIESEDEAKSRVLDLVRKQNEELESLRRERELLEQYARYGREYVSRLQQGQQITGGQGPEEAKREQAQAQAKWWQPPQAEKAWFERYQEVDPQSGALRWKADTPPDVIAKATQYRAYLEDWVSRLSTEPDKALQPAVFGILRDNETELESVLRPLVTRIYEQVRKQERDREFLQRVEQEHAEWLYEIDPRTKKPMIGKLSDEGKRLLDFMDKAMQDGVADKQKQWEYATAMLELEIAREMSRTTGQRAAAKSNAEKMREEHLRRAAGASSISSRAGSVDKTMTRQTLPQNREEQFGRQLLAVLKEEGVALP